MMRSMYSGVSGLKTHQTKMDVIGNNIANVNTVAYKSSSITFSELMYQTTQKPSGPNDLTGTGGTVNCYYQAVFAHYSPSICKLSVTPRMANIMASGLVAAAWAVSISIIPSL